MVQFSKNQLIKLKEDIMLLCFEKGHFDLKTMKLINCSFNIHIFCTNVYK